MSKEDSKYYKTTMTMMRRSRTMLERLKERTDISQVQEKCEYSIQQMENAIAMMETADQFASTTGHVQLSLFPDYETNN